MKLSFTSVKPAELVEGRLYLCGRTSLVDEVDWSICQYHEYAMVNEGGIEISPERFRYSTDGHTIDYLIFDITGHSELLHEPHHTQATTYNDEIVRELCCICNCKPDKLCTVVSVCVSMDRCFCDKPEDRLYHHSDRTWWRRTSGGNLIIADPPMGWGKLTD